MATPLEQSLLASIKNMKRSVVKELFLCASDGINYDIYKEYYSDYKELTPFVDDNKLVQFAPVDNYGGEGQGTTYYTIYEFVNESGEKVYIKFDGSYCSYNGLDYERAVLVEPRVIHKVEYTEKK